MHVSNGVLALGAETNFPFDKNQSRELALLARYSRELNEALTLSGEVTHRVVQDAPAGHPGRATEFALLLAHRLGPGRIEAAYRREAKRQADLGELAYAGEWPLRSLGAFLHYRFFAGARSARDVLPGRAGPRMEDSYSYHGVGFALPYRVGGSALVTAGADYVGTRGQRPFWSPLSRRSGGAVALSLAATYEF